MQPPRPPIQDPLLAPASAPEYLPPVVGPPTWRPPAAASSQLCPNLWPLWVGRSSAVTLSPVSQRGEIYIAVILHNQVCFDKILSSLCNRHDNEDHHHPHDLQAKRHCGSENNRKRSNHPRTAWQECGHHTFKCWGKSNTVVISFKNCGRDDSLITSNPHKDKQNIRNLDLENILHIVTWFFSVEIFERKLICNYFDKSF